jgi:phosphohistidine phosphatase
MRHAKSDWESGATSDFERPLNRRGRQDAPRIGRAIRELGWSPDWVVASSSQRTRETWEHMKDELDGQPEVQLLDELYHGGPPELAEVLSGLSDQPRTVLALGHNPGWQDAVSAFCGEFTQLKTANAVLLEAEATGWSEASRTGGQWKLVEILRPKELPDVGGERD